MFHFSTGHHVSIIVLPHERRAPLEYRQRGNWNSLESTETDQDINKNVIYKSGDHLIQDTGIVHFPY